VDQDELDEQDKFDSRQAREAERGRLFRDMQAQRDAALSALAAVLPHLDLCDECRTAPALWHSKSHTYRRCDGPTCLNGIPSGVVRVEYSYADALRSALLKNETPR
jgi:hypothetical protein